MGGVRLLGSSVPDRIADPLAENYSILDNIGYHRNVRIESYRPERIIRFIAVRENAEQAAMDLERSLRGAASLDVDLSVFEAIRQQREKSRLLDLLSQGDIDVATRLSRTVIETSSESKVSLLLLVFVSRHEY